MPGFKDAEIKAGTEVYPESVGAQRSEQQLSQEGFQAAEHLTETGKMSLVTFHSLSSKSFIREDTASMLGSPCVSCLHP